MPKDGKLKLYFEA